MVTREMIGFELESAKERITMWRGSGLERWVEKVVGTKK